MIRILKQWFTLYFSDPEAVLLFFVLLISFGLIIFLGDILAPVLAAIVLAYLLQGMVVRLQAMKIPHLTAVLIVFSAFLGLLALSIFVLFPLLWKQFISLFNDLPNMVIKGEKTLEDLSVQYPQYVSKEQIDTLIASFVDDLREWSKGVITSSLSSIGSVITWILYLVLVPLLVFFFLKDREDLIAWVAGFLPHKRGVLQKVSEELNQQIASYIRGKVSEILIVGIATYIIFAFFDLRYGMLLASLVGLSVVIPYVGIVIVSIPVVIVAYLQWGWTAELGYLILIYTVIQVLDANLLVPLLFSEALNLHPVAIIVATIFFGGIWGFWGVFFAIPLATLVKAVIYSWPKQVNSTHAHA